MTVTQKKISDIHYKIWAVLKPKKIRNKSLIVNKIFILYCLRFETLFIPAKNPKHFSNQFLLLISEIIFKDRSSVKYLCYRVLEQVQKDRIFSELFTETISEL